LSDAGLPALIFDCDGVLIDSEYLASRVESEVVGELGLSLSVEEAHALFLGKTVDGVLDTIAARTGRRPIERVDLQLGVRHARTPSCASSRRSRAWASRWKRFGGAAIAWPWRRNPPLARVRLSLQVAGLAGQFGEHIYVTSMVARPKPAPDIYLLAARMLGAAPADCIVIEDSPAGAAAARTAGMRVVGYAPGSTRDSMLASGVHVIRSMDELISAIEM
jgi:beta-phosphoglucomutase-like phosphatase (HAD superfamily)